MKHLLLLVLLGCAATFLRAADAPLDLKQTTIQFTGHATLHDFRGAAQDIRGSAQIDAAYPNLVTSAVLEIGAARLTTFEDSRDRNMRAWLHVDAAPKIEFRLNQVRHVGDPSHPARNLSNFYAVKGDFTLNGVTKPLAATVTGSRQGNLLVIDGATTLDTTQYGLPIIHQFFLTVDKNVDVTFHLVFTLPPGTGGAR